MFDPLKAVSIFAVVYCVYIYVSVSIDTNQLDSNPPWNGTIEGRIARSPVIKRSSSSEDEANHPILGKMKRMEQQSNQSTMLFGVSSPIRSHIEVVLNREEIGPTTHTMLYSNGENEELQRRDGNEGNLNDEEAEDYGDGKVERRGAAFRSSIPVDVEPETKSIDRMGQVYLSLPLNPQCRVDVSHIIKHPALVSDDSYSFISHSKCVERNERVDKAILTNGGPMLNRAKRRYASVIQFADDIYPFDHISVEETRGKYELVGSEEYEVCRRIALRMKSNACMQDIVKKYKEMNREIAKTSKERWTEVSRQVRDRSMIYEEYNRREEMEMGRKRDLFFAKQYYSDGAQHCDGCSIQLSKAFRKSGSYNKGLLMRKWVGDEEVYDISSERNSWHAADNAPYDVTAVVVSTCNRLFAVQQLLYRYRGPISMVIHVKEGNEEALLEFINGHHFPSRLSLIAYCVTKSHAHYSVFPVNILRNLAIRNIRTTHFLVLDMDLRVTVNTYSELLSIPSYIRDSPKSAVILPIVFFKSKDILDHCKTVETCAYLTQYYQPENKLELIYCIASGFCQTNKNFIRTHMYVMPEWYTTHSTSHISRIRCFITDFQEPYMVLRFTSKLPLFYPLFVDYGYNKVQYFEQLRQSGYTFYILNHAFAVDFPHPDSVYRKSYNDGSRTTKTKMRDIYNKFQKVMNARYQAIKNYPMCYNSRDTYYEEL